MSKKQNRFTCHILISLILACNLHGGEDLDHQIKGSAQVSLVLSSGDSPRIFGEFMALWMREQGGPFPTIVAQEPGPLELAGGLRLLPNEVPPRVSTPQLLVIVNAGNFEPNDLFISYLRRCLASGTAIWVIGPFPEAFIELALEPGQEIVGLEAARLGPALKTWCDR